MPSKIPMAYDAFTFVGCAKIGAEGIVDHMRHEAVSTGTTNLPARGE